MNLEAGEPVKVNIWGDSNWEPAVVVSPCGSCRFPGDPGAWVKIDRTQANIGVAYTRIRKLSPLEALAREAIDV